MCTCGWMYSLVCFAYYLEVLLGKRMRRLRAVRNNRFESEIQQFFDYIVCIFVYVCI